MKNAKGILKSLLQTGVYLIDQPDRVTRGMRDGFNDRVTNVGNRLIDVGEQLAGSDRTVRYALIFAAGLGVGVGVGMLMAPDSGEQTRRKVVSGINQAGDRIRSTGSDPLQYSAGS
jgi:hypothetical protein